MPPVPRIGTEFAGYRIEALVGRGGMSIVYRAQHSRLGSAVALKLLTEELAEDEAFRERFVRESRLAAGLNHPNVIPILDAGDHDGVLYLAMRYVDGPDLKDVIRRDGPLGLDRTLAVAAQVGSALDAAHARGLIHRDVKPANILIEPGTEPESPDHVYLADFGLTKHAESRSGLTGSGQFVGTIDYMAPEQIEGREVDGRTDIYSLGCVLFECLAGRPPFHKETDAAVLWAHMREDPPSLRELDPALPQAVDDAVRRAMAKSPDDRPGTARRIVAELRGAVDGAAPATGPTRLLPAAPTQAVERRRRDWGKDRRRVLVPLAALALGAGAAALGFVLAGSGGSRHVAIPPQSQRHGFTAADVIVLGYVPPAIRTTCHHEDPVAPSFLATVGCRGQGAERARYSLARSGSLMRGYFLERVAAKGLGRPGQQLQPFGRCATGSRAVRDWRAVANHGHQEVLAGVPHTNIAGRVLCYRDSGWSAVEWTDKRVDVYTIAFGDSHERLYRWWEREAGPSG